jgi:phage shock protein C
MTCAGCHREIADYSNFCYYCGLRQTPVVPGRRLMRSAVDKKIAGVCAGFAEYFDIDATVMRILWAFATLATGIVPGIVAYIVAWMLMPQAPYVSTQASAPNAAATQGSGSQ